jgi:thiol-disulfide isomerase/thioredoxin
MRISLFYQLALQTLCVAVGVAPSVTSSFSSAAEGQGASSSAQPKMTLVTQLGDCLTGHWIASDTLDALVWQGEGFVEPFRFEKGILAAIRVRHQTKDPQVEGTYRCELVNGDVLYGTPLALQEEVFVLDLPSAGPLRIDRNYLKKLTPRRDVEFTASSTPTELSGWKGDRTAWKEFAGRFTAVQDNAELSTTLLLGDKSRIAIEMAWEEDADFRMDFGSDAQWKSGLRIETWQDKLILAAESSAAADVLLLAEVGNQVGQLLLEVFVDTDQQTVLVVTEKGERVGEFAWEGKYEPQLRILSRKAGLRFGSASVTPWDGLSPESPSSEPPGAEPLSAAQSLVYYRDGRSEKGTLTAWNPESQTWILVTESASPASEPLERQVASAEIEAICLPGKPLLEQGEEEQDLVRVVSRTGMRVTGKIVRLGEHAVQLHCLGIEGPIEIALAQLKGLFFCGNPSLDNSKQEPYPRLQMGDTSVVGQLIEGQASDKNSALVWKPSASETASAISQLASGAITYRDPLPPVETPRARRPQRDKGLLEGVFRLFAKSASGPNLGSNSHGSASESTLHLRSGDSIPCRIKRLDSEGVTLASSEIEATFVPLDTIEALVLVDSFQPARMTAAQRDRLLTLPRIQQEYPPTHLLLSVDGDILRTRVTTMDDKFVTLEIRLNPVKIPRERVAAIVWLRPQDSLQAEQSQPAVTRIRVRAVQSDGICLTFQPQQFAEGVLLGSSDLLGHCRVQVPQVDRLLFGKAIQQAHPRHQLLALIPAAVPRFVTTSSSPQVDVGQGSALVGMEAPPIKLKDLSGSGFDLTELRGKVVVLDFWATWCGPCIQWMPQLEEIVANYPSEQVELVTINLLQEKELIEPVLERMQLAPTVLLDRDGVVADAYQATAIPQTVVVNQQGKIERIFIGGMSQVKQPLVETLDILTSESKTPK